MYLLLYSCLQASCPAQAKQTPARIATCSHNKQFSAYPCCMPACHGACPLPPATDSTSRSLRTTRSTKCTSDISFSSLISALNPWWHAVSGQNRNVSALWSSSLRRSPGATTLSVKEQYAQTRRRLCIPVLLELSFNGADVHCAHLICGLLLKCSSIGLPPACIHSCKLVAVHA